MQCSVGAPFPNIDVIPTNITITIIGERYVAASFTVFANVDNDYDVNDNEMYPKNSQLKLNPSKLEALGWSAKVGLDEMFERLINYLKEQNEFIYTK